MIDYKLIYDATLIRDKFWMHYVSLEDHGTITYMETVNCLQKWEFNLNQTNDDEDRAELSIPRETAIRCKQLYRCKHMHPVILM